MRDWELDWETRFGVDKAEVLDIHPWPWPSGQVAPEADGVWSAMLIGWDPSGDDLLDLGRYTTRLRARMAVEAASAELRGGCWSVTGCDDFGAVTIAQMTTAVTQSRTVGRVAPFLE